MPSPSGQEAFVYDHLRTPRGKGKAAGSLHEVKPVDLVVGLVDELRERNPTLDTTRIDDVVLGVVSPVGDQGGDIAKTAALAAGLPETTALKTGFVPQGIGADLIATIEGWSRDDVDAYAAESHHRAAKAWANGYFD